MATTMQRLFRSSIAALSLAVGSTEAGAQHAMWVVDAQGGPNSHTKSLVQAVTFSREGDVILVRPGKYASIKIINKALTILRDTSRKGRVVLGSTAYAVTVQILPRGKNVTIRGFELNGRVAIKACTGSVVLEDCRTRLFEIDQSSKVTISRCKIVGFLGPSATIVNSTLYASDTSFLAGRGGHGIDVTGSRVVVSSCDIRGGDGLQGGVMFAFCYAHAHPGGNAIHMSKSIVRVNGGSLYAGKPAVANPPCAGAAGGVTVRNPGGQLTRTRQVTRSFSANSPVREHQRLEIKVSGQNGDHAWLLVNASHDQTWFPGCSGAAFPSLSQIGIYYMGQIRSTPLQWNLTVPPLPATAFGMRIAAQALILPRTGCVFSSPSNIVLLDQRF